MLTALLSLVLLGDAARPAQSTQSSIITAPPAIAQQPATPTEPMVRIDWDDRPRLRIGSQFRAELIGKFQWDVRRAGDDPFRFPTQEIQRARIGVEGEFLRRFQYSIERELTEREIEGDVEGSRRSEAWKDVYIEAEFTDAAQVRAGKFKVPFGRDQLTGISNLDFAYRSLAASSLAPARDIGAMVSGSFFDDKLTYATGLFRHDGDNARSRNALGADGTVAARVTTAPFSRPGESLLDQLEIGAAFMTSRLSNEAQLPNGLRGRTMVSRYVFFEPMFVSGSRRRFAIDGEWRWEQFGARAEYMEARDTREGQGFSDDDLPPARGRAWWVSGAYVVTGEEKNWPVEPDAELGRGGLGAIEIVGRYERLWFDSVGGRDEAFRHPRAETILPSGDRVLTWGVNWYASRWLKLQVHAIREQLDDPERHPRPDAAPFWTTVFRVSCAM